MELEANSDTGDDAAGRNYGDNVIVIRKIATYVSCLVCMCLLAIFGVKGIFHHFILSLIFSFFFIVYLINFCYLEICAELPVKAIYTDEDLVNHHSFFGFPIRPVRTTTTTQGNLEDSFVSIPHSSSSSSRCVYSSSFSRPAPTLGEPIEAPPMVDADPNPPSYEEAMLLADTRPDVDCTYSTECETPPPAFELIEASSSWKNV